MLNIYNKFKSVPVFHFFPRCLIGITKNNKSKETNNDNLIREAKKITLKRN